MPFVLIARKLSHLVAHDLLSEFMTADKSRQICLNDNELWFCGGNAFFCCWYKTSLMKFLRSENVFKILYIKSRDNPYRFPYFAPRGCLHVV